MTMTTTDRTSAPSLELVRPVDLKVESQAQRGYDPNWAKALADNWDDEKVGVFKVTRRNGELYVQDGQHRRGALILLERGDEEVFALIYDDRTVQDDAKAYVADNYENRKPNPVDTFRLQVTAGDPQAVEIDKILRDRGLHVALGPGRTVSAVAALRWVHNRGGGVLLDATLAVIESAWGAERTGRDGNLLKGTAYVLDRKARALHHESLVDKLAKSGSPAQLLGNARAHKMATGRALYLEVADAILAIYNRGRSVNRLTL